MIDMIRDMSQKCDVECVYIYVVVVGSILLQTKLHVKYVCIHFLGYPLDFIVS